MKLTNKTAVVTGASKGIGAEIARAGGRRRNGLEGIEQHSFERQFNVNVLGLLLMTQEAIKHFGEDGGSRVVSTAPLRRIGQPDDIAPTAVFLASSDSKYLTGETVVVSGGF